MDGWFGPAVRLEDGSVRLAGIDPQKESFSLCFWIRSDAHASDPVIIGNKDWTSGKNPGAALVLAKGTLSFNAADGTTRADIGMPLPRDYMTGWVFAAVSVDRTANTVGISLDFAPMRTRALPDALKDVSFSTGLPVRIGQDGTGAYGAKLPAVLDEFLILAGPITDGDVAKLKEFYGV